MSKQVLKFETQIKGFKKDLAKLDQILRNHVKGRVSDSEVLRLFESMNKKYVANVLVLTRLLIFLQLTNDEKINDFFSLKDIGDMFDVISSVYKDDVELNIEKYYFIFNVQNKEKKAKEFLDLLKARIGSKLNIE